MGLPPLSKIPFILRPQAWLHRRHYGEVLSPIRWWVFAGTDPHEITEHDIVVRYFNVFAVAVHKIVGSHQNRQFVKSTLSFQFGADAYAGIDDDDHAEHRVAPRSSDQYHNHGRKDDAVEQGEHVGSHDIDKRT